MGAQRGKMHPFQDLGWKFRALLGGVKVLGDQPIENARGRNPLGDHGVGYCRGFQQRQGQKGSTQTSQEAPSVDVLVILQVVGRVSIVLYPIAKLRDPCLFSRSIAPSLVYAILTDFEIQV